MAWRSSGRTNQDLINNLVCRFFLIDILINFLFGFDNISANRVITNSSVKNAMLAVDRAFFSPREPYMDSPQSIGYNVTISAPHMHAYALEVLKDHLKEGSKALDVGSGSGYLTACMAMMVKKNIIKKTRINWKDFFFSVEKQEKLLALNTLMH